jgi:hypothetical protein
LSAALRDRGGADGRDTLARAVSDPEETMHVRKFAALAVSLGLCTTACEGSVPARLASTQASRAVQIYVGQGQFKLASKDLDPSNACSDDVMNTVILAPNFDATGHYDHVVRSGTYEVEWACQNAKFQQKHGKSGSFKLVEVENTTPRSITISIELVADGTGHKTVLDYKASEESQITLSATNDHDDGDHAPFVLARTGEVPPTSLSSLTGAGRRALLTTAETLKGQVSAELFAQLTRDAGTWTALAKGWTRTGDVFAGTWGGLPTRITFSVSGENALASVGVTLPK